MSELVILQQLMLGIQQEQHLAQTPKPCEIFDLIGGTSTGGLIAMLLGRLQLSVDEALNEYARMGEKIFSKKKKGAHEGHYYATKLEEAVQDVVQRYGDRAGGSGPNLKLADEGLQHGGCRV